MTLAFSKQEEANRYDFARGLPQNTMQLWMDSLKSALPGGKIKKILDLGSGTGRFTIPLGETFQCPVVGVEPSEAMLNVAAKHPSGDVEWKQGFAEQIPLHNASIDLVFMSMVYHHLPQPENALREIQRVLQPRGYLAIRNATLESNREIDWLPCFPEALEVEEKRMLSQETLIRQVCGQNFELISSQMVSQFFAGSYQEYFEKIKQRGLSALIGITDTAFAEGLERLRAYINRQTPETAVYEPVDLFIFQSQT